MSKIYALLDCNNFFVSCERAFRPELKNKPVVVLSNNDGCVVSRSNEAKNLDIPMGIPLFKIKAIVQKHKVQVCSSNFALYGDMSNRVMTSLKELVGKIEPYSIDEAFFYIESENEALTIKEKIFSWTGIPVSIGIGKTKTLAKAANEIAKKNPEYKGVLKIEASEKLNELPSKDIWGIGRSYSKLLENHKVKTAADFINKPEKWIKTHLKSPGMQVYLELKGIECKKLKTKNDQRKSIINSRSFRSTITNLEGLAEALATYTTNAAAKLRSEKLLTKRITTYITVKQMPSFSDTINLDIPTSDTAKLIKTAHKSLRKIFKSNLKYKKAGIMLSEFVREDQVQLNLFQQYSTNKALKTMDFINSQWGKNTLTPASTGLTKPWQMKSDMRSPAYTTNWSELMQVK